MWREISGTSRRFLLSEISRVTTTSLLVNIDIFRHEYLDDAEALPMYIWNAAAWRSREFFPRPNHEKDRNTTAVSGHWLFA